MKGSIKLSNFAIKIVSSQCTSPSETEGEGEGKGEVKVKMYGKRMGKNV